MPIAPFSFIINFLFKSELLGQALFIEGFTLKEIIIRRAGKQPRNLPVNWSAPPFLVCQLTCQNSQLKALNQPLPKKVYMNFWNQLESKQITDREAIEKYLLTKLGTPTNEIQTNLLAELTKKINSYYTLETETNYTTYSLFGSVSEIQEKKYKEGKSKGQVYYVLKLGGSTKEILQARKEDLPTEKWNQIVKLALLGQNLVFKYKKWITNKQLLDFYPPSKTK
ncbi:MAG: hypothetical protein MRECE_7c007 [Mycoplasmataceae bacterium CE_OT135]|nr:MAG: hypothetical protein MRECE_7c007 [Mycoplasmataceae bacterium CE_OT135]